jgi:hypothetical protein
MAQEMFAGRGTEVVLGAREQCGKALTAAPGRQHDSEVSVMHASMNELPVLVEAGPSQVRGADWGAMRVAVVSVPAGADFGPLLKGLPDDRCQGEHWGYVIKGRLRITHADNREEVLGGGDFYHLPPGHTGVAEEATDFIEIGEPRAHQQFVEAAKKNIAAMVGA